MSGSDSGQMCMSLALARLSAMFPGHSDPCLVVSRLACSPWKRSEIAIDKNVARATVVSDAYRDRVMPKLRAALASISFWDPIQCAAFDRNCLRPEFLLDRLLSP